MPEGSDTDMIRACKLWDKATRKMSDGEYEMPSDLEHVGENRPYTSGDYRPLQCRITGKQAELTVGSSTGHKAKVDLKEGTLQYFDNDEGPNQVIHDLLEEDAGLRCEKDWHGVKCTGVAKKNIDEVFKIMAMPTSMDFRLDHCNREKRPDPTDECADSCHESLENDYKVPDGCDCSQWENDCTQECVDNYEYDSDEGECQELEKQFYRDGVKKETLTKTEALINPKSQTSIAEWGE